MKKKPGQGEEFRFVVESAHTPDTLPSNVLAQYLVYLSALFGEASAVHFKKLAQGSVAIIQRVDEPSVPKVRDRLRKAQRPNAPEEIQKPKKALDKALALVGAKATLYDGTNRKIVEFRGRDTPVRIGPVEQAEQLDGVLIWVGGGGHPAHAELQSNGVVYKCTLDRDKARALAQHLYGGALRVAGNATWYREPDAGWVLENLRIDSFEKLGDDSLAESVAKLRGVEGSAWEKVDDPLAELQRLRHGGA